MSGKKLMRLNTDVVSRTSTKKGHFWQIYKFCESSKSIERNISKRTETLINYELNNNTSNHFWWNHVADIVRLKKHSAHFFHHKNVNNAVAHSLALCLPRKCTLTHTHKHTLSLSFKLSCSHSLSHIVTHTLAWAHPPHSGHIPPI